MPTVKDDFEISLDQTVSMLSAPSRLPSTKIDPVRDLPPSSEPAAQPSTIESAGPEVSLPATKAEDFSANVSAASAGQISRCADPTTGRLRAALKQLAEVLNELHAQGKLHRDIKPSNVLVTRAGRVVLLDFGLSKEVDEQADPDTTDGHIVGTVTYMAPEQAGGSSVTAASDWYAVGVMLYRTLTGRLPHSGKVIEILIEKQRSDPARPRELCDDVPEDLDGLCMELLQRDPDDRPSGDDILRRLGGSAVVASGLAAQRRPFVEREESASRGPRRRRSRTSVAGRTASVFVHGRSGAGKSSLIERFLGRDNRSHGRGRVTP